MTRLYNLNAQAIADFFVNHIENSPYAEFATAVKKWHDDNDKELAEVFNAYLSAKHNDLNDDVELINDKEIAYSCLISNFRRYLGHVLFYQDFVFLGRILARLFDFCDSNGYYKDLD